MIAIAITISIAISISIVIACKLQSRWLKSLETKFNVSCFRYKWDNLANVVAHYKHLLTLKNDFLALFFFWQKSRSLFHCHWPLCMQTNNNNNNNFIVSSQKTICLQFEWAKTIISQARFGQMQHMVRSSKKLDFCHLVRVLVKLVFRFLSSLAQSIVLVWSVANTIQQQQQQWYIEFACKWILGSNFIRSLQTRNFPTLFNAGNCMQNMWEKKKYFV